MTEHAPHGADRILVTGAAGFLGRHIVAALAKSGSRVTALLGPPGAALLRPAGVESCVEADICDEGTVRRLVAASDIVVHLAGPPSVAQSFLDPALFARVHVQGTATIAEAAIRSRCRRVIYISSAEVYGRSRYVYAREDHQLEARSPYAACKIAAEQLLTAFSHAEACEVVILRPFSLYGPGAPRTSLLEQLLAQARAGYSPTLHDPRPVRDFCFISDLAHAVQRACAVALPRGAHRFNIGTMRGTSVGDLARMLLSAMGLDLPVSIDPEEGRPGSTDILRLVADITHARELLGWAPRIPLEEGLRLRLADPA